MSKRLFFIQSLGIKLLEGYQGYKSYKTLLINQSLYANPLKCKERVTMVPWLIILTFQLMLMTELSSSNGNPLELDISIAVHKDGNVSQWYGASKSS